MTDAIRRSGSIEWIAVHFWHVYIEQQQVEFAVSCHEPAGKVAVVKWPK